MKTIEEIKKKIETIEDIDGAICISVGGGYHPLMTFIPEYHKPERVNEALPLTTKTITKEMQRFIDEVVNPGTDQEKMIRLPYIVWFFEQYLWLLEDKEITSESRYSAHIGFLYRIFKKYNLIGKL